MRPYTPLTKQGSDEFSKGAVQKEVIEERCESPKYAEETREVRGGGAE